MKYKFIGWCRDEEKNQDKVWICIQLSGDIYHAKFLTVWGRRGKTLQSKLIETSPYEMEKLINSKINVKGYATIKKSQLDTVYPEFQEDLEKTAMWAALKV